MPLPRALRHAGRCWLEMRESRQSKGIMTKTARPHQLDFARCPLLGTGLKTALSRSVAQVMQVTHHRSGSKAVDAKKVPASVLKPSAEPFQGKKPGEEGENCAQQAGKCG